MSELQNLEAGIGYSENGNITYYENQGFAIAFKDIMDDIHSTPQGRILMRAHMRDNVIPELKEVLNDYLDRINHLALSHGIKNQDEIDGMIKANMNRRGLLSA